MILLLAYALLGVFCFGFSNFDAKWTKNDPEPIMLALWVLIWPILVAAYVGIFCGAAFASATAPGGNVK